MIDFYEIETKYGAGTYAKQELAIVRGQGAILFDADGGHQFHNGDDVKNKGNGEKYQQECKGQPLDHVKIENFY
jgi:acetylornithine/succinyldiaminopimelate/putrescine aminotransferase